MMPLFDFILAILDQRKTQFFN